ncbi:MAG: 1-acyl-sn-glycerol-3-phosphate acyltransferase [Oscillospiraceae bacterium]|jgi:1-acyl-sn-glycerol-3-phosphate acyltransferase|nr:1-acyl-sn-glycerol-3-phosphate acyltransferase [Oscillospiraceae bacterium]
MTKDKGQKERNWYKVYYAAVWLAAHLLYRFKFVGRENIPEGSALICGNHSSNWDIIFVTIALGRKTLLRFTPKVEMKKIPLLGPMMNLIGVVWIDRSKPSDLAPVRKMLNALNDGDKVVLFPEGHRLKSGEAESVKSGAIMLASKSGTSIVPVNIPRKKRIFRRNIITFGSPYTIPARVQGSAERNARADELMIKIRELTENSEV